MRKFINYTLSPNIIRMMKSRRISWTGRVARVGSRGMYIGFVLFSKEVNRVVSFRVNMISQLVV
jgi:hypothetical protein